MENTQTAKTSRSASAKAAANHSNKSKSDLALAIFNRLHGKKARKDIVEEMSDKLGLAPSSANTYYQKFLASGGKRTSSRPPGTSSRGRLPDESSKAGIARAIFRRLGAKKARKDVIAAFVSEADLTPAGASTYYQKLKHAA